VVESNGSHVLAAGDAAGWKAGDPNAHTLRNHTDQPVRYLIVGSRSEEERCHYTDIDMEYNRDSNGSRFTRRDGSPF